MVLHESLLASLRVNAAISVVSSIPCPPLPFFFFFLPMSFSDDDSLEKNLFPPLPHPPNPSNMGDNNNRNSSDDDRLATESS